MKVLAITFEPWETTIAAATNAKISYIDAHVKTAIFIADFWQLHVNSANENFLRIIQKYNQTAFTLENEFNRWQGCAGDTVDYEAKVLSWAKKHNIQSSTRILESSDHIFSCFERAPFYRPISRKVKAAIFYHYAIKIENVLEEFSPDIVWCIERNYLAKNIFAALCDAKKIPLLTLIRSRVSNYWYFSRSFVYPFGNHSLDCCDPLNEQALSSEEKGVNEAASSRSLAYLAEWRDGFHAGWATLYLGATEAKKNKIEKYETSLLSETIKDAVQTFRALIRMTILSVSDRRKMEPSHVYRTDWWRTCIYVINGFVRRTLYSTLGLPGATRKLPDSPYFYFPLHHRPESSTLTLGRGLTDELAISNILPLLPHGTLLAVKENPMIVDDRRRSFHRWLSSRPGVVLLDPSVSSQALIANALGVISISGTALLEAGLIGVPAHAIGKPEFYKYLCSSGLDNLEDFMIHCALGHQKDCREACELYLTKVFDNGQELTLGWDGVKDEQVVTVNATTISSMLFAELDALGEMPS